MEIELKTEFRPEFLNRIGYKIVFDLLKRSVIEEIVEKNLLLLEKKLANQGISLAVESPVLDYLADFGTEPENGARPLARLMERSLKAPISDELLHLSEAEKPGTQIHVSVTGEAADGYHRDDGRVLQFTLLRRSLFS